MNTNSAVDTFSVLNDDQKAAIFGAIMDNAFESILITSAPSSDGYHIDYVNHAFTEMTGYDKDEVLGKSPSILQGPKTDTEVIKRLAEDLSHGRTFHGQAVNYRKDGSEFMLEWKAAPVRNGSGEVTHLISVQREMV